jgi:glycosyltransferase involved in cell wall biosynthesis
MTKKILNPILSVVVTTHHEGIVAHKTILSLTKALEPFDRDNIAYEIIVHVDTGDEPTHTYFSRYKDDPRFRIYENSFGNPAESRNFAIQQAAGRYTAIIDGDDLISRNWFIESYRMIKEYKKPVILRPNFQLQFGGNDPHHNVWLMEDSFSKEEDALIMCVYNRWPNILFTTTSVLRNFPFRPTVNGFGFEDWLFNCDVREAEIPNLVVPATTLFYRRRENSVTSEHVGTVLPFSKLFEIDFIKSIPLPSLDYRPEGTISKLKRGSKRVAVEAVKQIPVLREAALPRAQKIVYKKQLGRLPQGLIDGWREMNAIDSQLYPAIETVVGVRFHPLSFDQHNITYGAMYKRLVDQISKKPDYLFLVPRLATGGTEKLLFNYIAALTKAHPDWHIAVLSALPKDHPYVLPPNVDFIDFDGITAGVGWHERDVLWSRLLIQLGVKRLHIINHEGWYRWIASHKKLLAKNDYTINVSMFMREYTPEKGRIRSFAEPFLTDIYPVVNKVFTDNQNVIDEMLATNAFDPSKLIVHYQPTTPDVSEPRVINVSKSKPLRILWASRLSHQKRPDIVKKIAEQLDSQKFHIDVYGRAQHYDKKYFDGTKSLTYKGPFNGINTLPTTHYDIYLYTSDVDGVPNILLEIAATGLPIVASDDGGVGEFIINNKTGLLVDVENIAGYIKAFEQIRSNPERAKNFAKAAQDLMLTQHSVSRFEKEVARDIN